MKNNFQNVSEKVLVVSSLTKTYFVKSGVFQVGLQRKTIIRNLSFELSAGTNLGILGPSGVGKSTLAKIICRIEDFDSGEVIVDNRDIKEYSRKEFASKVQLLFQNPYSMLNPKLTIGFLLKERFKQYFYLQNKPYDENIFRDSIEELLKLSKLSTEILKMYPYQLSGGQRQRVATITVLCLYPKILILDEPLSALDISLQAQMLNFFYEIKEKFNLTYIFITHDRDLAEYFCDKILYLHEDGEYEIFE
ncbi:MAG: dipeptide/oligopeptide/nickel ABC transporter ATP-binding protein [Endomicrobia bacterium]|nr:dipeptide/oligopeptide/nickel ABC transporter ATP-binding protein [Endomicrobiia bacterium]MDW8055302.1 dipeptide/oligopeptide/nickel ABC transporter ATP-binding protein [Elusimicrobiota bacterium]